MTSVALSPGLKIYLVGGKAWLQKFFPDYEIVFSTSLNFTVEELKDDAIIAVIAARGRVIIEGNPDELSCPLYHIELPENATRHGPFDQNDGSYTFTYWYYTLPNKTVLYREATIDSSKAYVEKR